MFSGKPLFFFNHSKDISELTILNPCFSKFNFFITLPLPLPAPPAKKTTFLFGFGKPSVLGILALTPDLVVANVSSKSQVDIPTESLFLFLPKPKALSISFISFNISELSLFLVAFLSIDGNAASKDSLNSLPLLCFSETDNVMFLS